MASSTSPVFEASSHARPPRRSRVGLRRGKGGRPKGSKSVPSPFRVHFERERERSKSRREQRSMKAIVRHTLSLITATEVNALARETGFYQRTPRGISAFDFVLSCALAAIGENKRGFASVWRLLTAANGVELARSAVTQRFGDASARLLEKVFLIAIERVPSRAGPETLARLKQFRAVLANDGSVITVSPLLKKLFPSTRTNSVAAAGKVHATADLVRRRIVAVEFTGERESELAVARAQSIEPETLYTSDLGYTSYDYFKEIKIAGAHLLWRLKDNANPTIVTVRHGVRSPAQMVHNQIGLNDPALRFTSSHDTFDVDALFPTRTGEVKLRVVGCFNAETQKYHCYVTTLAPEQFSPEELAALYQLRWVIELLFKLLKSSCHMDHVDTSDPGALRTHIYASLLAATLLASMCQAAAEAYGLPDRAISGLMAGIAAPLLAMPLLLLCKAQRLTPEHLADMLLRTLAVGCRDQNPNRTQTKWGFLGRRAQR